MSKDLWIREHEAIGEEYADGKIDRDEAEARLRALGFDAHEIADQLDSLEDDRNCDGVTRTTDLTEDQLQWCRESLRHFEAMERQAKASKEVAR